MLLIVLTIKGDHSLAHPESDALQKHLAFLFFVAVSPLVKYLGDFLIIVSLINGYIFTALIDDIITCIY